VEHAGRGFRQQRLSHPNGNPINSANSAQTSLAIDLSTPGVYDFRFAGDNVTGNT